MYLKHLLVPRRLFVRVVVVLSLPLIARSACYKLTTCEDCIAALFNGGGCMWYEAPGMEAYGTCIAGVTGNGGAAGGTGVSVTQARSVWSTPVPGSSTNDLAWFTVFDVDQASDGSCYDTLCQSHNQCNPGFFAILNRPCYSGVQNQEYRILRCCRQQRDADGYLRGVEVRNGLIQGQIFYGSCCLTCFPGQVNHGCTAFSGGQCKSCLDGTYNALTIPGSICLDCQPCQAGRIRVGCGPSSGGSCATCEAGTFKVAGLEGSFKDTCVACAPCPMGSLRVGCGADSPGRCESCPSGKWFASPVCRSCDVCASGEYIRGCGGLQMGVCSRCDVGWYEDYSFQEMRCKMCPECPAGFTRVGCAGSAKGACVRLLRGASAILEAPDVNYNGSTCLPAALEALRSPGGNVEAGTNLVELGNVSEELGVCPGAQLTVKWNAAALDPLILPAIMATKGNCSNPNSSCMAGAWVVELMRRTTSNPEGTLVLQMARWINQQLSSAPAFDGNGAAIGFGFMKSLSYPLPQDLAPASGYFFRINFTDDGTSCCAMQASANLSVVTAEFTVTGVGRDADGSVEVAFNDMLQGKRDFAISRLEPFCMLSDSLPAAQAACDQALALKLGLPIGDGAFASLSMMLGIAKPAVARTNALQGLQDSRAVLEGLDNFRRAQTNLTTQTWAQLVLGSAADYWVFNSSSASSLEVTVNSSERNGTADLATAKLARARLSDLLTTSRGIVTFADSLASQWRAEATLPLQHLSRSLDGLKTLDTYIWNEARASGFDLVRMAQALTNILWDMLAKKSISRDDEIAMVFTSLQTIGNFALMMVGSWGNSWNNDIQWRVQATLGTADGRNSPYSEHFGGAPVPPRATPIEDSRLRVWQPFRVVADLWLDRWANSTNSTRRVLTATNWSGGSTRVPTESTSTPTPAPTMPTSTPTQAPTGLILPAQLNKTVDRPDGNTSLDLLANRVSDLLDYVELLTERVLEPITRAGSQLLAGNLPNMGAPSVMSSSGYQLTFSMGFLSEDSAGDDAWYGFGPTQMRPWLPSASEYVRLRRAASEIVGLVRGRLRLLEGLLLELVDVRQVVLEPQRAAVSLASARAAVAHVAAAIAAPLDARLSNGPAAIGAAWRWLEIRSSLDIALQRATTSVARLCRRRLRSLEGVASWLGGSAEALAFQPRNWKIYWPVNSPNSAVLLSASENAAKDEADRALAAIQESVGALQTGLLRYEISADSRPMSYASLESAGTFVVRLIAPPGADAVRMYSEARAFIVSPNVDWIPAQAAPCSANSDPSDCQVVLGTPPNASIASTIGPYVELQLQHLAGSSGSGVSQLGGPFISRHQRQSCNPLMAPGVLDQAVQTSVGSALLPLDGIWLVTARDGVTGRKLQLEPGTILRILFKVNVPQALRPWQLLGNEPPDVLYALPASGKCADLKTIFGESVVYTSTTLNQTIQEEVGLPSTTTQWIINNPTTTKDTSNVTTSSGPANVTHAPDQSFLAATDGDMVGSHTSSGGSGIPWTAWLYIISISLVVLTCCSCCFIYLWWQRRKLRKAAHRNDSNDNDLEAADEDGDNEAEVAEAKSKQLSAAAAIGSAWCPPGSVTPWSPKVQKNAEAEDWNTTDTPRKEAGSESSSSPSRSRSSSASRDSSSSDSDADTPRAASSSSGSASCSKSRGSSPRRNSEAVGVPIDQATAAFLAKQPPAVQSASLNLPEVPSMSAFTLFVKGGVLPVAAELDAGAKLRQTAEALASERQLPPLTPSLPEMLASSHSGASSSASLSPCPGHKSQSDGTDGASAIKAAAPGSAVGVSPNSQSNVGSTNEASVLGATGGDDAIEPVPEASAAPLATLPGASAEEVLDKEAKATAHPIARGEALPPPPPIWNDSDDDSVELVLEKLPPPPREEPAPPPLLPIPPPPLDHATPLSPSARQSVDGLDDPDSEDEGSGFEED